ncbi:MAG: restriction endonuclease subunit S [Flavobacterium sp.]|uniref:restriction endonuclease subunit S n=1 Tax=Flavobacterium sp. TaxID=239 RepID=UPI0022C0A368|nr:restriction endonuclease subunit S [Flavobacterium sp.]MCZ8297001.1 restriction endonuclease subunit S [Flavobacterium sp.]
MGTETNVPKLRFPEFNTEWNGANLKDLTRIYDGTHQTPKYVDSGIPFYSVEHVTSNNFKVTKFISEEVYDKEINRVKIERGDILMTRIGDIGTSRLVNWEVKASFYVSLALIKKTLKINSEFLNHTIGTLTFQKELWNRTIHVAFPKKINLSEIGECKLKYPTISEQTKIASFLTAVDDKLQALKKKKELLEQYKKGVMQQLFSQELRFKKDDGTNYPDWEEKKLGELSNITTGKLDANAMVENGKYRFYTCAKEYYRIDKYAFDTEALLISGNGANVGYIHHYKGKFNAYQRTYVLDGFNQNIIYIKYFLDRFLSERISAEKKEGNTPYIVLSTLSEMKILIPTFDEQNKIANFLSVIDDKIAHCQSELDGMERWKKGLLQQMFC